MMAYGKHAWRALPRRRRRGRKLPLPTTARIIKGRGAAIPVVGVLFCALATEEDCHNCCGSSSFVLCKDGGRPRCARAAHRELQQLGCRTPCRRPSEPVERRGQRLRGKSCDMLLHLQWLFAPVKRLQACRIHL
ncbi:uncharacterized protein LOC119322113 [Triticum dicoccoides]|uniref:uncharacterized protein LOC119322113 n=1 Tax=Triticum dicoccoides TaxID=85692 RepID=UPI00189106A8|nr:uncharacterized protein LOC119322113 [Triticum dicoccoides]